MKEIQGRSRARYAITEEGLTKEDAWDRLTEMFFGPEGCWLRRYPTLEPMTHGAAVGVGSEYRVRGSLGGLYPLVIVHWKPPDSFGFTKGRSLNPPAIVASWEFANDPSVYNFMLTKENGYLLLEGSYKLTWRRAYRTGILTLLRRLLRRPEVWGAPKSHLAYTMGRLPVGGHLISIEGDEEIRG